MDILKKEMKKAICTGLFIWGTLLCFGQKEPGSGRGIETGGKKPTEIRKELSRQNKKHAKREAREMKKKAKKYQPHAYFRRKQKHFLPFLDL